MTSIVLPVVGGLAVAAIVGLVRMRRLRFYPPGLFSDSLLTDRGTLTELVIANRGFVYSEEGIHVTLPHLRYQLVGSTARGSSLDRNVLTIPRLAARQEVRVILLVEGGDLDEKGLATVQSKEAVGKPIKDPTPKRLPRFALRS